MKKSFLLLICILGFINSQAQKLTLRDLELLHQCDSPDCDKDFLQELGYTLNDTHLDKEKNRLTHTYVTQKNKSRIVIVNHPDNMMVLYSPAEASIRQEFTQDIEKRGVKIPGPNDEMANYRMEGTDYLLSAFYDGKKLSTLSLSSLTTPSPQLLKGESAEHVRFADADGKLHYLSEFKGKVVYINMWASWCKYCLAAVPEVKKMVNQLKPDERKNVVFLFLNGENEQAPWLSAVRRYEYDKFGPNFQIIPKPFGDPKVAFVLRSYPSYTIIDKQGRLWKNWAEHPGPQAIAEIRKLLNQ